MEFGLASNKPTLASIVFANRMPDNKDVDVRKIIPNQFILEASQIENALTRKPEERPSRPPKAPAFLAEIGSGPKRQKKTRNTYTPQAYLLRINRLKQT